MELCQDSKKVAGLFEGWQESFIYSYLQGCMGECYVDHNENPKSAQIIIADFIFYAGIPDVELIQNIHRDFCIAVPQTEEWSSLIEEVYGKQAIRQERYALLKEKNIFDKNYLEDIVQQLEKPYQLKNIDANLYNQILSSSYQPFHDLCSQFASYEYYLKHGLGVVIVCHGEIVAGASSYIYYQDGIEIEIDTHKDYRHQGLATICGAKLILECLDKNLYPSWDAHNQISLALAEKLGYHFDKSYHVYEIIQSGYKR